MFGLRIFKRNKQSLLRLFAVSLSFCFIWILMKYWKASTVVEELDWKDISSQFKTEEQIKVATQNHVDVRAMKKAVTDSAVRAVISKALDHPNGGDDVQSQSLQKDEENNLVKLRRTVKQLNKKQKVLNIEKFPHRSSSSIVIVVQVHTRTRYLTKLIQSLKSARGISDALLIFSHDYYASDINSLVTSIDFCQVIQIYFPFSEQLHPNEFPGTDPDDCPRNTPRHEAIGIACNNAEHPDMYGHYREAKFTMTKHHWWWKANYIFHNLHSTRSHQGLVLFLEEDHYVAPDFYEVIQKAYLLKKTSGKCQERGCDILTLGNYKKVSNLQDVGSDVVQIQPWRSTENNMGMAFDRKTWDKIHECYAMFCRYDDYNWDFTLMKLSIECLDKPLTVLLVKAPRVFHLGTCGLHHNTQNCDVEETLRKVKSVIENSSKVLYPQHLVIEIAQPWIHGNAGQPNGGWGDIRDHELCERFARSTKS